MPWFGDGNVHRMTRYVSNDPIVIARQIDVMQQSHIAGMPIQGVIMTWQGPFAPFQHSAVVEWSIQCIQRRMLFALLLDPWIGRIGNGRDPTENITNAIQHPSVQRMLNASSYIPEHYILDFETGARLGELDISFPGVKFLQKGVGFSWPSIDMNITDSFARNQTSVNNLAWQNTRGDMKVPGYCMGFNDAGRPTPIGVNLQNWTGTRDQTQSVWSDQPARILDPQAGHFFKDQIAVTPLGAPYWSFVTWNDYDERTDIEAAAAIAAGIEIS